MSTEKAQIYKDTLNVVNGFCAKADGKDKLTALIQYACMFISAGEPGNIKKVQASVTAARKVFRVMRPLESIMPLLQNPGLPGKQHPILETITMLKSVLMGLYFGADHLVWAYQIGLISNKTFGERSQKVSLYSWALGSVCTMITEAWQMMEAVATPRAGESEEDFRKRQAAAGKVINQRAFVFTHGLVQALLAVGLLQLLPWKPRTVGALGVVASTMNCYLLLPAMPKRAPADTKQQLKVA